MSSHADRSRSGGPAVPFPPGGTPFVPKWKAHLRRLFHRPRHLVLDEMPEHLLRDIGLLDGPSRVPRGECRGGTSG